MGATTISSPAYQALADKVCEHDKWIDGSNGNKGAKSRLDSLEENYKEIKSMLDSLNNRIWTLIFSIIGGLVLWFLTQVLPKMAAK